MKKEMTLKAEQEVQEAGYVWSMNMNLGDGKMLQVTGNFAKGASASAMSQEVDKVSKMFTIQRLKQLEIPTTENALRGQAESGDRFTDELETLLEQYAEKARIPSNVEQHMKNLRENIRKTQENLEAGKGHLDKLVANLKELEAE